MNNLASFAGIRIKLVRKKPHLFWLINNFLAGVFCLDVAFRNVRYINIVMLERDVVGNTLVAVYALI